MSCHKQSTLLDIFKSKKRSGSYKTSKSKQLKGLFKSVNTANAVIVPKNTLLFSSLYVNKQNNDNTTAIDDKTETNCDESFQPETIETDKTLINNTINEDEASSCDDDSDEYNDESMSEIVDPNHENENVSFDQNVFINDLVCWAIKNNVNHVQLKGLLNVWNEHVPLPPLPMDPRTLLSTPRVLNFISNENAAAGQYWHYGLQKSIIQLSGAIDIPNDISLNVNIDGLPPYKTSKIQIWPILFNIHELKKVAPMVIGIFCGEGKNNCIFRKSLPDLHQIFSKSMHVIVFFFRKTK